MATRDRSEFGPNAWLIDEMFRRFQEDPGSVGEAWREFFDGYRPRAAPATSDGGEPRAPAAAPDGQASGAEAPQPAPPGEPAADDAEVAPLRGAAALIAERMEESLGVPTATSVRTVPARLLEVNRNIVNRHIARKRGRGKVSFTHLIGWAVVKALQAMPAMNVTYRVGDGGVPEAVRHEHVNLGLAVDVKRKDG